MSAVDDPSAAVRAQPVVRAPVTAASVMSVHRLLLALTVLAGNLVAAPCSAAGVLRQGAITDDYGEAPHCALR